MKEIGLIIFGWLLGLAGPIIVEKLKDRQHLKSVTAALRVELEDLQYRLAICSLSLLQRHGSMDADFLSWVKPILERYAGNEPTESIRKLVAHLSAANEQERESADAFFRAKPGMASSVKTLEASFLESHLKDVSRMPVSLQRKIHEFRNQFEIFNQEVKLLEPRVLMTFNSSVTEGNFGRLNTEIDNRMKFIQQRSRYAAEKIEIILSEMERPLTVPSS